MRQRQETSIPDRFRFLKAVAFVLATLLVAPGIDAVIRYAVVPGVANASDAGIDAAYLTGAGDAYVAIERIEDAASAKGADVPPEFAEEIGFLPGAYDVRASADGSVVGYTVKRESGKALDEIVARMRSIGWTEVSLGEVEGATFVKSSGSYTWALATCTQVGTTTSVVVRCVMP